MGIITQEVEIKINQQSGKYYEDKGYNVPKKKSAPRTFKETGKEYVYDSGKTILVNVNDLSHHSHAIIECECDYCGKSLTMPFYKYTEHVTKGITHTIACLNCSKYKRENSNMTIYGVPNVMQVPEIVEKNQQSLINGENYIHSWHNPNGYKEFQEKMISLYGHPCSMRVSEIKEKAKETTRSHWGVDYSLESDIVREKGYQTLEKKYGTRNISEIDEIKEAKKQTSLNNWGVENPSQNSEIKKKISENQFKNNTVRTSNQQLYLNKLYGGSLNDVVGYYNCDIVFHSEKIVIEYLGSGHDLSVKLGKVTEEQFYQHEIQRSIIIKRNGYKIINIISRKDYLPQDDKLLEMLEYARKFFQDNNEHSWITFDIDNNCILNAFHKTYEDSLSFNYEKLRKIKKTDLIKEAV